MKTVFVFLTIWPTPLVLFTTFHADTVSALPLKRSTPAPEPAPVSAIKPTTTSSDAREITQLSTQLSDQLLDQVPQLSTQLLFVHNFQSVVQYAKLSTQSSGASKDSWNVKIFNFAQ